MRAIQKKPEHRYPHMMDMVDDLKAYLLNEEVSAHSYTLWEKILNWERRNILASIAIASALLGGAVATLLLFLLK